MKKWLFAGVFAAVVVSAFGLFYLFSAPSARDAGVAAYAERKAEKTVAKRAREAYFHQLLRDPATDALPDDIRQKEVTFARTLPLRTDRPAKSARMPLFDWHEAGPSGVGGRTRALGVDLDDPNTLIAGGVSGGIWKSTDGGASWTLRGNTEEMLHITAIAQDPRPGSRNVWYAGGGEFRGSSNDNGGTAFVYGAGIYVSTDNGDTWATRANDPTDNPIAFDSEYDYIHRIVVSPTNGNVFVAANAYGIWKSVDQGASFSPLIGPFGLLPQWSDVAVGSDGTLVATLSSGFVETPTEDPGIYRSINNGTTWSNITPADFPASHERSVIAIPPSNPGIAYVMTFTGESTPTDDPFEDETITFYRLDLTAGTAENRSANLPDFGAPVGVMTTQFNYNMVLAVKPDDEEFVLIGGINLFRSRNGLSTPLSGLNESWIGGYDNANNISQYPNQHPDQHAIAFDPTNPNRVWTGHDGGISVTEDVGTPGARVTWTRRNDGYNVTQYYHVAIAPEAGDERILGGTQDNGSPFFRFDPVSGEIEDASDVTSGDGAYSFFGENYALASSQFGRLLRFNYGIGGALVYSGELTPIEADEQLFIHPYAVDRADETVIYYPDGRFLWRYTEDSPGAGDWVRPVDLAVTGTISALATGVRAGGSSVLYYARFSSNLAPQIYRLDNATSATSGAIALPIGAAASGAYVHDIAVNPSNGDELLVVLSNYNIKSLFHSTDAGATFTEVEGNLDGTPSLPGPSVRSAAILPVAGGTLYVAGTSTGVYVTDALNGGATEWVQEGDDVLGKAIVHSMATRRSDGRLVLGTHGRGVFIGVPQVPVVAVEPIDSQPAAAYVLEQNYPNPFQGQTEIVFALPATSRVRLTVFDVTGREVMAALSGEVLPAGSHRVSVDASSLAQGAYIYTLEALPLAEKGAAPYVASRTLTLVR